jgi:NAD(P)H-dependent nitrite reductase small subunit
MVASMISKAETVPFQRLCKLSELKEGKGKPIMIGEIEVAVFLLSGKVYAINNVCPHHHSSILSDGIILNAYVICPAHGWEFCIRDGKQPGNRRGVDAYETKVEAGVVFARVSEKRFNI